MIHYNSPRAISVAMLKTSETKANLNLQRLFTLGILAGAYVALAGNLATVVAVETGQFLGAGITRLLMGSVFAMGLTLVVLGGGELFTGNALMIMGRLSKRITTRQLLWNWFWVYIANFIGSLLVVALVYLTDLWQAEGGQIGARFVLAAQAKTSLSFTAALTRGILANWLVCLGVWLAASARDAAGKILAIYFPVMAFVACGHEHSIANQFSIPMGIVLKNQPALQTLLRGTDLSHLNWANMFTVNLLPVTIGNIIGGALFVGVFYWYAYIKLHEENGRD